MQTECPHCHSVFRIDEAQLNQADGQVRCGHCLAVFTAENPYHTQTFDSAEFTAADSSEALTDSLADSMGISDVIPPELRAESRRGKKRFGFVGSLFLTLGIILSIIAGLLQYAYYNRQELVKITELRPWLQKGCELAGCTLPPPKDVKSIILSSKNIFTHPNIDNALMVSVTIINQANFSQEFPILELRFENVRGQTIAARRFQAEEYLGINNHQIAKMQPDTPISFNLEIEDPGNDMVSYEFDFL